MKIIIMQGLPASGKSTRAKEIIKETGNTVRINKDLIRKMLHFDKWTGNNENLTRKIARAIAKEALLYRNVIIDDTNLNLGTLQSWKDLAKELNVSYEIIEMATPIGECLQRDALRNDRVGSHVIIQMALQNGLYPNPALPFVLCDIDGTLADIKHRLHFAKGEKKDWKSFFDNINQDIPRQDVINQVLEYEQKGHPIIFVTARPEEYRIATEKWIKKAFGEYPPNITTIMRKSGDKRADTEVKSQMFSTYFENKYPIEVIFDDRPSVIRMWREKGLNVIDVGEGIEF